MKEKVLITGGSGFMGSHVADALSEKGYDVTIFDAKESKYLKPEQKMVIGDICDENAILEHTKNIDYIFHFAGIADIAKCSQNPALAVKINISGTTNILNACVKNKIKRLIFASSVYVFSDFGSIYKTTKQTCESLIEDFSINHNLKYTILRYGSLYGPRADESNGVLRILKGLMNEKNFYYDGTGEEIREFINTSDAANISVNCLAKEFENKHIIVTGLEKMRMKDLITMIQEITGKKSEVKFADKSKSHHYTITPYKYSPKKGEKLISNPYIDMGQGLLELVDEITRHEG